MWPRDWSSDVCSSDLCTAANRFYVHSSVAGDFTRRLVERTRELVVGPGIDPSTTLGPLIDEDAVAKVEELVADAVERGARMVTGGERGAGGRDGDGGGNAAGGENAAAGGRDGAGGGNDAAGGGF